MSNWFSWTLSLLLPLVIPHIFLFLLLLLDLHLVLLVPLLLRLKCNGLRDLLHLSLLLI